MTLKAQFHKISKNPKHFSEIAIFVDRSCMDRRGIEMNFSHTQILWADYWNLCSWIMMGHVALAVLWTRFLTLKNNLKRKGRPKRKSGIVVDPKPQAIDVRWNNPSNAGAICSSFCLYFKRFIELKGKF